MTLYSTAQAGQLLGLSPVTVKWYCQNYPEVGQQPGRNWVLTDDDLSRIREHMGKPGPKPTDSSRTPRE